MSGAATVSKCNQVGDHLACLGLIEPPDDPRTVYFHFWIARLDQKLMGEVSMLELPATVFYGGLQRGGEFLHSVSIHSQQHGIVAEIEPGGELNANGAHASPQKTMVPVLAQSYWRNALAPDGNYWIQSLRRNL